MVVENLHPRDARAQGVNWGHNQIKRARPVLDTPKRALTTQPDTPRKDG